MAEIGCYAGESSLMFMESEKIKTFYAIDPWSNVYTGDLKYKTIKEKQTIIKMYNLMKLAEDSFDVRMKSYDNVIKLKMILSEAFDKLPKLDFIYIDGNHDYDFVINDIKQSKKLIKYNGIIAGHDYNNKCPGVIQAVKESFNINDIKIYPDTSWLIKIK